MCLHGLRCKKHIFHIPYIIVAPLWPAFLKRANFYKAHCSEKYSVLWLASCPAEYLNRVTEMLRPLPDLETHSVSTTCWQ